MRGVVEGEVEVLQDLCEPEALHVVNEPSRDIIHIVQARERNGGGEVFVERRDGGGRAVEVLGVTRNAPCIEVGFKNFGALDVVRASDVKPMLVVECQLGVRDGASASEVAIQADERKGLGANTGSAGSNEFRTGRW